MDRYLRSLFEKHIKKIGQQKYNKNKEFEKVILIKIHIYTLHKQKIYKNILRKFSIS